MRVVAIKILYTITYMSRLTQKNCTKKGMLFLASMGETGLCHDIFFLNSHLGLLRLLRSNDNWPQNFEAALRNLAIIPESLAPHLEKVR